MDMAATPTPRAGARPRVGAAGGDSSLLKRRHRLGPATVATHQWSATSWQLPSRHCARPFLLSFVTVALSNSRRAVRGFLDRTAGVARSIREVVNVALWPSRPPGGLGR